MELFSPQLEFGHLLIGHLESGLCGSCRDQIDDDLMTDQWLRRPVRESGTRHAAITDDCSACDHTDLRAALSDVLLRKACAAGGGQCAIRDGRRYRCALGSRNES